MSTIRSITRPMPSYDEDLYSDAAILEPYTHYQVLRDLGPAGWLPRHQVWALARYADVTAAVRDHALFSSAAGVAISETTNKVALSTTISSDRPRHDELRKPIGAPLTLAVIKLLRPTIEAAAEKLVALGRREPS